MTHADCRKASRTLENIAGGSVDFTPEELAESEEILDKHEVKGLRYSKAAEAHLWG